VTTFEEFLEGCFAAILVQLSSTLAGSPSFPRLLFLPLIPTLYGSSFSLPTHNPSTLSSKCFLPLPTFLPKKITVLLYLTTLLSSILARKVLFSHIFVLVCCWCFRCLGRMLIILKFMKCRVFNWREKVEKVLSLYARS
jgi:hypothetical protein